jgi:hypothetical protein
MSTSQPTPPPTDAPVEIYLGKNGETHGPYTVEQYEQLRAMPEFASFTYIWDGRDPAADWKPIPKAAPPAPPAKRGPGAPPPDSRAVTPAPAPVDAAETQAPIADVIPITRATDARKAPVLRGYDVPWIEALCHDSRNVIAGKLTQVTDAGCELLCPQSPTAPAFGSQSRVILNLLDPKSGQAMNVAARLGGVSRRDGRWSLRVLWDGCPELIVSGLERHEGRLEKAA